MCQKELLTPALLRVLCNALMQPHFNYACCVWYPKLSQKLKNKLHTAQNKHILFYEQLEKSSSYSKSNSKLPVLDRFNT